MRIDPGLNPDGVLTLQVYQPGVPGQPPPDFTAAFKEIRDRLTHTPGVAHAAVSTGIPLRINMWINSFDVKGRPVNLDRDRAMERAVSLKLVTPGYHEALGIPLKRGRLLGDADAAGVVVINETAAAKRFFGGEDPLGQDGDHRSRRSHRSLASWPTPFRAASRPCRCPEVYLPLAQERPELWLRRHSHQRQPVRPAAGRQDRRSRCLAECAGSPRRNHERADRAGRPHSGA